jgi:hypothetical protein
MDRVRVFLRAFSVTVWSVAGMHNGLGEALCIPTVSCSRTPSVRHAQATV